MSVRAYGESKRQSRGGTQMPDSSICRFELIGLIGIGLEK